MREDVERSRSKQERHARPRLQKQAYLRQDALLAPERHNRRLQICVLVIIRELSCSNEPLSHIDKCHPNQALILLSGREYGHDNRGLLHVIRGIEEDVLETADNRISSRKVSFEALAVAGLQMRISCCGIRTGERCAICAIEQDSCEAAENWDFSILDDCRV